MTATAITPEIDNEEILERQPHDGIVDRVLTKIRVIVTPAIITKEDADTT